MKGRRLLETALVVAFLALGLLVARYLIATKKAPGRMPPKEMVLPVKAQRVRLQKTTIVTEADGEVLPKRVVQVVPQVPGKVLYVAEALQKGGILKKDQVILKIEDRDYKLRLQQAEAELKRAEAELARIKADQEAATREWKMLNPGAEPPPLVRKEPQLKAAEAAVLAAKASLEKARLDLERTTIRAPFDCIVLEESVDRGQFVFSGQSIARLASIEEAQIRVFLSDRQIRFIRVPGFNTTGNAGSEATVEATIQGRTEHWRGLVTRAEPVDPKTRRIPVVVEVKKPYGKLPPLAFGLYVKVRIKGPELASGAIISKRAIEWDQTLKPYVWSIDTQNRARRTPVNLIQEYEEEVLVSEGLRDGQFVILDPPALLTDGTKVKVVER